MFEAIQIDLETLLRRAATGHLQLPDFQRGWVWEEEAIRSLLASVARRFPIGAILTLKTGGEIDFKPQPIEGAPAHAKTQLPEELLLDGQQRTTSFSKH